jgi:hypothetical protein
MTVNKQVCELLFTVLNSTNISIFRKTKTRQIVDNVKSKSEPWMELCETCQNQKTKKKGVKNLRSKPGGGLKTSDEPYYGMWSLWQMGKSCVDEAEIQSS